MSFLLVVALCAGEPALPAPRPAYFFPPAVACPAVDPHRPVTPAPLAADFQPVAVARCDFVFVAFVPPDGMATGWFWRQVDRGTGPVDRLAAALRKPPPPRRGGGVICSSDTQSYPQDMLYLVLTDAAGRTAIPAIPLDECGKSLTAVTKAVAAMRWQTVDGR